MTCTSTSPMADGTAPTQLVNAALSCAGKSRTASSLAPSSSAPFNVRHDIGVTASGTANQAVRPSYVLVVVPLEDVTISVRCAGALAKIWRGDPSASPYDSEVPLAVKLVRAFNFCAPPSAWTYLAIT